MITVKRLLQVAGVLALLVLAFLALRVESVGTPDTDRNAKALKAVIASIPAPPGAVLEQGKKSAGKLYGRYGSADYSYRGPSANIARHYDAVLLPAGWTPCKVPTPPFGKPDPAGLPKGYTKSVYEVTVDYIGNRVAHDPRYYVSVVYEAAEGGCS